MTARHLLLIDSSGFAYRAFHAGTPLYRESDGFPTWAILGFMSMLWRILGAAEDDKPTHGAAIFDAPGKTFRHDIYPAYKAHRVRAGRLEELMPQLPLMREAARTLGFEPLEVPGFEADDVLATLAAKARRAGIRVTIVGSDKDLHQLVADGRCEIVDPMSRQRMLEKDIEAKWGVPPKLMVDLQALAGDTADGYDGVKGVGVAKAARLLRRFGSLQAVIAAANTREPMEPMIRTELRRHPENALLGRELATLRRNVPLKVDFDALEMKPVLKAHIQEICRALEATARIEALFALDPKLARPVEPAAKPWAWWEEEMAFPGQNIPDLPQAGFYQRRLVKGGPMVPCRIWREKELDPYTGQWTGFDALMCEVGPYRKDPLAEWTRLATQPIPKVEYRRMVREAERAKAKAPDSFLANPTRPIDLTNEPVVRLTNSTKKVSKSA